MTRIFEVSVAGGKLFRHFVDRGVDCHDGRRGDGPAGQLLALKNVDCVDLESIW
jgi:hypothetical protein